VREGHHGLVPLDHRSCHSEIIPEVPAAWQFAAASFADADVAWTTYQGAPMAEWTRYGLRCGAGVSAVVGRALRPGDWAWPRRRTGDVV